VLVKAGDLEKIKDTFEDQNYNKDIINNLGNDGWNSLHFAVFCNQESVVRYLLSSGSDVNLSTKDGWTPLQLAVFKNYQESKLFFLKLQSLNF
jgi:serum/glucocorticoid-regulated kinase 2